MDEYIDVAHANGTLTGRKALKSVIHAEGLFHHTAHLWLYTETGHILLAQRAATKLICPLLWDVSVAGHIDAGETPIEGVIRETKEEIDLDLTPDALSPVGVFKCEHHYDNGIQDNEFHNTFIAELKVPLAALTPQDSEVEALKLVSFTAFEGLLGRIGENLHFIASNKAYYETVFRAIKAATGL